AALRGPSPVASKASSGCTSRATAASSRRSAAITSTGARTASRLAPSLMTSRPAPSLTISLSARNVAMFFEPDDAPRPRVFDRILRQAQLAHGFSGVEPHAMTRHLDAFDRHIRPSAGDVDGPEVFQPRIGFGDPVRHL